MPVSLNTTRNLEQEAYLDKHAKLSNLEKIFGVNANNLVVNVIIMATKEVMYRKRQGNGIPNSLHMKRILYNQMIKEKVLMSSKVEKSNEVQ